MGAEGDARLLDYHFDIDEKEAERIFKDVFGGNWKSLGQWLYKTKVAGVPEFYNDRYTGRTHSSKTLKISYKMPVVKDVDSETGSEYEVEVEDAPNFEDKHVFLADGSLYNINYNYGKNTPFNPPADLKLRDVKMMRIPMSVWLLLLRPTEFHDTATVCMAFKKMIMDQAKSRPDSYLAGHIWLMTGDEMLPVRIHNTKVYLDNRQLTLEEVQALHGRRNDFWMGKYCVIKKLFTHP